MVNPIITGKTPYANKVNPGSNAPAKDSGSASDGSGAPVDQVTLSPEGQKLLEQAKAVFGKLDFSNISEETLRAVMKENSHAAGAMIAA